MPSFSLTFVASSFSSGSGGSCHGTTSGSGLTNDEGIVTAATSTCTFTSTDPGPPFTSDIEWSMNFALGDSAGNPLNVTGASWTVTDYAGGGFNAATSWMNLPSTTLGASFDISNAGINAVTITATVTYDKIALTSINFSSLNAAGGQTVILTGIGFSDHAFKGTLGHPVMPNKFDHTKRVESVTITDSLSNQIVIPATVLDGTHVQFTTPDLSTLTPGTCQLQVNFFTVELGAGSELLSLPFYTPFLITVGEPNFWFFNPTSGHYRYAAVSPGEPFEPSDPPVPTITGFSPRST